MCEILHLKGSEHQNWIEHPLCAVYRQVRWKTSSKENALNIWQFSYYFWTRTMSPEAMNMTLICNVTETQFLKLYYQWMSVLILSASKWYTCQSCTNTETKRVYETVSAMLVSHSLLPRQQSLMPSEISLGSLISSFVRDLSIHTSVK